MSNTAARWTLIGVLATTTVLVITVTSALSSSAEDHPPAPTSQVAGH
ncbi:hypothetical protein ACWGID_06720 [Kribbella sp. NPDC054772]